MKHQVQTKVTSSSKKTVNNKKNDLLHQVIKLTKQNQYLNTKINCLYEELEKMTLLKDKYKRKYRQIKLSCPNSKSAQKNENIVTLKNFRGSNGAHCENAHTHTQRTYQEIEDPYTIANTNGNAPKRQVTRIMGSLEKIDEAILGLNNKIGVITQWMQPTRYQEIWARIAEMGDHLNLIISKLQGHSQSLSIQQCKTSEHYGLESGNLHIPVKQKREGELRAGPQLQRFRFIQSKSQRSFQSQLKNGRVRRDRIASQSSSKNKQEWKTLKEIGKQLKNWKFSQCHFDNDHDPECLSQK